MERLKALLTGSILGVILFTAIFLAANVASDIVSVQAGDVAAPAVQYAQLTDAQPLRNIAQQQFAPAN
jgi:hypothetical protein